MESLGIYIDLTQLVTLDHILNTRALVKYRQAIYALRKSVNSAHIRKPRCMVIFSGCNISAQKLTIHNVINSAVIFSIQTNIGFSIKTS